MSAILDPPATVLLAGVGENDLDDGRQRLLKGEATHVRAVDDVATATTVVSEDDVACVVVGPNLTDATRPELCASISSDDPDLPLIVVADDLELLRAALAAGATDVLDPSDPVDRLRELVDDAVSTYQRRRVDAEHTEILTTMLDGLDKSIYVKDESARLVHFADVSGGFDPEEARGKTDVELYGDDDPVAAREAVEDDMRVIEDEVTVTDRDERVDPDGEDLWMRTTKVPWTNDDGDVKGLVGLTFDVTDFKHTDKQLEELGRRFETFTSRLGHDVKTPLQVASGYLDIARETGDPEALDKVAGALDRIDEIVDDYDILNERTAGLDDPTSVELRRTVAEVWSALDSSDAELDLDVEDGVRINATESMVRPVVENLLKNAVTHAGEDVTIRVGLTEDGFYVEDSGRGIPESEREKVLQAGYTTHCDGSGRGLSIVTDEMDKHVWSLSLGESSEGGARFDITNCRFDVVGNPDDGAVTLDTETTVGTLEHAGEAEYVEEYDRWSISADGTDVFRKHNDFYYVHATVDGPVSIRGQIPSVDHVDDYSKGGFMVRDAVDDESAYGSVGKTASHGTELLWRDERGTDGESLQLDEQAFTFDWYRLERRGDELSMYFSLDGEHWQEVGTRDVSLSDPVEVGLLACSCRPGQQTDVRFEDVVVTKLPEE